MDFLGLLVYCKLKISSSTDPIPQMSIQASMRQTNILSRQYCMLTDFLSLKKIKTAHIGLTCQSISARSFNNVITLSNKTINPNHYFNNHINKQIHEHKTIMVKFTYGGIYRGRIYQSPLKHLGSVSIKYLTNIYNTAPNINTILYLGKDAPTISILKPNKDHNIATSYQSIYHFYQPLPKP